MSTKVSQELLEELVKVGVGGKYRDTNNYLKLVQQELDHENYMMTEGQNYYNNSIKTAKENKQESITLHGLVLQQKYIGLLSDLIHKDITLMNSGKAGNYHTALKLLPQCLPNTVYDMGVLIKDKPEVWDEVSLIVLKNIIDGISFDEISLNKIASKIGTSLMQEAKILAFREEQPSGYKITQRKLENPLNVQNKNKYRHKSKVWAYMMNRYSLKFDNWTNVQKLHLGVKMVSYVEVLGLVKHQNRKVAKNKTVTYLEPTQKVIDEIKNFNIKNELLFPKYMPMIMPPRDWSSPYTGGYYGRKFNKENKAKEVTHALQLHKTNK